MLTRQDRVAYQLQLRIMFPYLVSAFKLLDRWFCEDCGVLYGLTFDHKRYAPDITIADLRVLCWRCHKNKTEYNYDSYLSGNFYCPHCPHCQTSF